MKVMMMAREGERADNRINRVSSERPTTTPHVEKWKFDIRSFCSVPGITGKTDPLVVVSGVPGGGEVKPLIHLSQQQQKSQGGSSTTNHPPTCPALIMALLDQGIPNTPIERRPLSQSPLLLIGCLPQLWILLQTHAGASSPHWRCFFWWPR